MPHLHEAHASLRISGDSLDPDEISMLLKCTPSKSHRKGQTRISELTGRQYTKRSGAWFLEAKTSTDGDVDRQVYEILVLLPSDLKMWESIASQYRMDLICGWFMRETSEGIAMSAATLYELGARGIKVSFDLYAPDTDA